MTTWTTSTTPTSAYWPRQSKVPFSPNPPLFTPKPPTEIFHDAEVECDEEEGLNKVHKIMFYLKGKNLAMFHSLMDIVGKHTKTIGELQTLLAEEKERNDFLERNGQIEEACSGFLRITIQSNAKECTTWIH